MGLVSFAFDMFTQQFGSINNSICEGSYQESPFLLALSFGVWWDAAMYCIARLQPGQIIGVVGVGQDTYYMTLHCCVLFVTIMIGIIIISSSRSSSSSSRSSSSSSLIVNNND